MLFPLSYSCYTYHESLPDTLYLVCILSLVMLPDKCGCAMANEPTGNLNYQAAQQVCTLILELNREFNSSLVTVIHDQNIATHMERCLVLGDGVAFNSSGSAKIQ